MAIYTSSSNGLQLPDLKPTAGLDPIKVEYSAVEDALQAYTDTMARRGAREQQQLDKFTQVFDTVTSMQVDNPQQEEALRKAREQYGIGDDVFSGVSLDIKNPDGLIALERGFKKFANSREVKDVLREQYYAEAFLDGVGKIQDPKLREIAKRDYEKYRRGDKSGMDLSAAQYETVDYTTIIGKKIATLPLNIDQRVIDNGTYVQEIKHRSVAAIDAVMEDALKDAKVRNNLIAAGYVVEEEDGTYTWTEDGEKYKANLRTSYEQEQIRLIQQRRAGSAGAAGAGGAVPGNPYNPQSGRYGQYNGLASQVGTYGADLNDPAVQSMMRALIEEEGDPLQAALRVGMAFGKDPVAAAWDYYRTSPNASRQFGSVAEFAEAMKDPKFAKSVRDMLQGVFPGNIQSVMDRLLTNANDYRPYAATGQQQAATGQQQAATGQQQAAPGSQGFFDDPNDPFGTQTTPAGRDARAMDPRNQPGAGTPWAPGQEPSRTPGGGDFFGGGTAGAAGATQGGEATQTPDEAANNTAEAERGTNRRVPQGGAGLLSNNTTTNDIIQDSLKYLGTDDLGKRAQEGLSSGKSKGACGRAVKGVMGALTDNPAFANSAGLGGNANDFSGSGSKDFTASGIYEAGVGMPSGYMNNPSMWQVGDVIASDGGPSGYGHIQVWTGTAWVSDFDQGTKILEGSRSGAKYGNFKLHRMNDAGKQAVKDKWGGGGRSSQGDRKREQQQRQQSTPGQQQPPAQQRPGGSTQRGKAVKPSGPGESDNIRSYTQEATDSISQSVDIDHIDKYEGGVREEAYIPKQNNGTVIGQSGVTVGAGLDLGQQNEASLRRAGIPDYLIEKFKPYFGKKKDDAVAALKDNPLKLSKEEATMVSRLMQKRFTEDITANVNKMGVDYGSLPKPMRTALMSQAYRLGMGGFRKRFGEAIKAKDWAKVRSLIKDGGGGSNRVNAEVALVEQAVREGLA